MTNNDYIRRAVNLADGWKLVDNLILAPFGILQCPEFMHAGYKDALAAQLTRQVDATEKYTVGCHSEICFVNEWVLPDHNMRACKKIEDRKFKDGDRTMNTLKAIIDSKVLNTDGLGEGR